MNRFGGTDWWYEGGTKLVRVTPEHTGSYHPARTSTAYQSHFDFTLSRTSVAPRSHPAVPPAVPPESQESHPLIEISIRCDVQRVPATQAETETLKTEARPPVGRPMSCSLASQRKIGGRVLLGFGLLFNPDNRSTVRTARCSGSLMTDPTQCEAQRQLSKACQPKN